MSNPTVTLPPKEKESKIDTMKQQAVDMRIGATARDLFWETYYQGRTDRERKVGNFEADETRVGYERSSSGSGVEFWVRYTYTVEEKGFLGRKKSIPTSKEVYRDNRGVQPSGNFDIVNMNKDNILRFFPEKIEGHDWI